MKAWKIFACSAVVLSLLAGAGCPPSQNPPDDQGTITAPQAAAGKLVPPPGFAPETLRVVTNAGEAAVAADGSFLAQVISNAPSLVPVVNASDAVVLLGFLTPSTSGDQQISAKSTAVALLYFALGGGTIPHDFLSEFIETVNSSPATTTLATVIETALIANPNALKEGDPAIESALLAAAGQLSSSSTRTTNKMVRTAAAKSIASVDVVRSEDLPFLNISPATIQSGIILTHTGTGDGVIATNSYARPAIIYALQVGYDDAAGQHVDLPVPEKVAGPFRVIAASSIKAAVRIGDLFGDSPPEDRWASASTDPILLPLRPGSSKTFYKIIAIGPALDQTNTPAPLSNTDYASLHDEWKAEIDKLRTQVFVFQFMLPIAESLAVGPRATILPELQQLLLGTPDTTPIFDLQQIIVPELQGAGITLTTLQSYDDAIKVILERAANNVLFRSNLVNTLLASYNEQTRQNVSLEFMEANLRRLAESETIKQAVAESARLPDLGRAAFALQHSKEAVEWSVDIARVRINPAVATITREGPFATLTAQVAGGGEGFQFTWHNSASVGNITTSLGDSGSSFTTTSSSIQYIAAPTSVNEGQLDVITVDVSDANGNYIGSAGAVINGTKFEQSPCVAFDESAYNATDLITLSIDNNILVPGQQVTATVNYDWSHPDAEQFGFSTCYSIYCSYGCSDCNSGCNCNTDEYNRILEDGAPIGSTCGSAMSSGRDGVVQFAQGGIPGIDVGCHVKFPGSFVKPEGGGASTHTVTFTIHENSPTCPTNDPDCSCPTQFNLINGQPAWGGLFVYVSVNKGSALRSFQMAAIGTEQNCP